VEKKREISSRRGKQEYKGGGRKGGRGESLVKEWGKKDGRASENLARGDDEKLASPPSQSGKTEALWGEGKRIIRRVEEKKGPLLKNVQILEFRQFS